MVRGSPAEKESAFVVDSGVCIGVSSAFTFLSSTTATPKR